MLSLPSFRPDLGDAADNNNSDAQGNSADGGSTAADKAEAVDQQLGWQWDGSIAGQVGVWGHIVVPAPAVVVRTASPCPSLMASTLQFKHADLNMLALQNELLPVQAGPTLVSTAPLLLVGMLPHHLHQRHFFVSNLPRSEGQIEGYSLQVAREQPTGACLICEQQRGRTVGGTHGRARRVPYPGQ
jgi:hypothetical protein